MSLGYVFIEECRREVRQAEKRSVIDQMIGFSFLCGFGWIAVFSEALRKTVNVGVWAFVRDYLRVPNETFFICF